jgi:serine/threonine protein kinase
MSLESFLTGSTTTPPITKEALWEQVLGISSALNNLHYFRYAGEGGIELENIGYHHDLKPQNILIKDGIFLLADFGLANLKDFISGSGTANKHGALTYGAPETMTIRSSTSRIVGRALDIWSLGCIFIEIITLELMDNGRVEEFRQYRTTSTDHGSDARFHQGGKVKKEVEKWIELLREDAEQDNYLFAKLVGQSLDLVIKMLEPDAKTRLSSALLHQSLGRIVNDSLESFGSSERDAKRSSLVHGNSPSASEVVDITEEAAEAEVNLEAHFDKDHPVMKALGRALGQK